MSATKPELPELMDLYQLEVCADQLQEAQDKYRKAFEKAFPGYLGTMTRFRNRIREVASQEIGAIEVAACKSLATGALALELKDGQVFVLSSPQGIEVSTAESLQDASEYAARAVAGSRVFTEREWTNSELSSAIRQQLDFQELGLPEPDAVLEPQD
jgi:cation transport regulator ChaB